MRGRAARRWPDAGPSAPQRTPRRWSTVLDPGPPVLRPGAVYSLINHGRPANLDYFVPLADAFLHGRLGLKDAPSWLNEVVRVGDSRTSSIRPRRPCSCCPFVALFGPEMDQASRRSGRRPQRGARLADPAGWASGAARG